MCVIAIAQTRRITKDELTRQWNANPDGAGIAYVDGDLVKYEKGFTHVEDLWKAIKALPLPYVVHTRIATVGGPRRDLTHPFPVTPRVSIALKGQAKTILFHNGHWSGYAQAQATLDATLGALNGAVSDSRVMARALAVQGLDAVDLIPQTQRVVLMTHEGVEMYGNGWTDHHGMITSNCSWQYASAQARWASDPRNADKQFGTKADSANAHREWQGALAHYGKGAKGSSRYGSSRYVSNAVVTSSVSAKDAMRRAREAEASQARARKAAGGKGLVTRQTSSAFVESLDREVVSPAQQMALAVLEGRTTGKTAIADTTATERFLWQRDDNDRLRLLAIGSDDVLPMTCTGEDDCDCVDCRDLRAIEDIYTSDNA